MTSTIINPLNGILIYPDGLTLRKTKESDANGIMDIIRETHISEHNNEENGFLCHFPHKNEYEKRLEIGAYNQVALIGAKIVGFLSAFSNEEISGFFGSNFLQYEKEILESLSIKDKFIWIDQLAIYPSHFYRRKIGSRLIQNLINKTNEIGYQTFYGTISLYPETNIASINFLVGHLGFKIIKTITFNSRKWALIEFFSNKE